MAGAGRRASLYYGWWILLVVAVGEMFAMGGAQYSLGLFVKPLEHDFGLHRADINTGFGVFLLMSAVLAPVAGRLLDRWPLRWLVASGGLLFGAGFLLLGLAPSPWLMVLALALPVAFGAKLIGPLAAMTIVARWFHRRRGRALGLCAVATSAGGVVVAPVVALLIEEFGWRGALIAQGALVAAVVPVLALLVLRNGPSDLGLETHPENEGRAAAELAHQAAGAASDGGWTSRRILGSRNFWAIMIVEGAVTGVVASVVISLAPYAMDLGSSASAAALLVSVLSGAGVAVKLLAGFLGEHVDRRLILCAAALLLMSALAAFLASPSYPVLVLASCLTGAALGALAPTAPGLFADCFGTRSYGAVMGMSYLFLPVFGIGLTRFMGQVHDRTGDYRQAFLVFLTLAALAAGAALFVRAPRVGAPSRSSAEPQVLNSRTAAT